MLYIGSPKLLILQLEVCIIRVISPLFHYLLTSHKHYSTLPVSLSFLDPTYKWLSQSICLWLISLNICLQSPPKLLQVARYPSSSGLNNIPYNIPYMCVCVCVCHLSMSVSVFFMQSSVEGQLRCFHDFAVVNIGSRTCEGRYLYKLLISISLDIYARVELMDHMEVPFLSFWGPLSSFPLWLYQFTFPPTMH